MKNNLQYRSMAASEYFADQAQRSSRMMESLTHEMHDLAVQTKQETVSMRIITLVTLCFLPGTFVAVLYKQVI
jgi:Mg2+ and Co2+ transporter CorA